MSYPNPVHGPNSIDADLGYDGGTMASVGGSGSMGMAHAPADPMNFVPEQNTGPNGMPVSGDIDASWGYPGHYGDVLDNP